MKAFVHQAGKLQLSHITEPPLNDDEVVVSLKVSGLNRRDLYISDRRGHQKESLVLGSDGAGIVTAVGDQVTNISMGDEVIINPALRWYTKSAAPPKDFEILGLPDHGTFAEKIVINAAQLEKKPEHLSWDEAGVLGLSGLTGYRAMFTRGQLQKGETVFIPGASSGVATFLIMFAKKVGARVIVTSRSETKRQQALELGADVAIDTIGDWQAQLKDETIDLVIESVGAATFNRSLSLLKQGGKIVVFGATTEDVVTLNLRDFFYGQYDLLGTTMGSQDEFREMLSLVKKHEIRPVIDQVYSLSEIETAFTRLQESTQFGKVAIQIDR